MGLGDWGTILLVLAAAWGVWTFVLSPNSGLNRDIGGGLFDIATHNSEGLQNKLEKYSPKLKSGLDQGAKICPSCIPLDKNGDSPACLNCIKANKTKLRGTFQNALNS